MRPALAVAALLPLAAFGGMQEAPHPAGEEPRPAVFLREDSDIAHALTLAEGYEKAQAWKEAAEQYQKVLDAESDVLVPVDAAGAVAPEGSDRYEGARRRALKRIGAWPPEGRQVLAAVTEVPARALWEHAGADTAVLKEIAKRYPFSLIGEKAIDRLGDVLVEAGDAAGAAACWDAVPAFQAKRKAAGALLGEGTARVFPTPWTAALTPPARPGLPLWSLVIDPEAEATRQAYLSHGLTQPFPYFPLLVDDAVVLATARGVTVLERGTGRVRWTSGDPARASRTPSMGPFTAAVSDGLCLAVVDDRLSAFDMAGGRKLWETPSGARVVTPPLLHGGIAYVGVVEQAGAGVSFAAWALAARDGRVLWRRHVISSFDRGPLVEGLRGAVAVAGTGVLFSTDMGCVTEVDSLTGDPRWLLRYDALKEGQRRLTLRTGRHWDANPIGVSEGRLLLAPRDSEWLFCLREEDGGLCWREPRREASQLLGVDAGKVFLGGPPGVRALALADKKPLWETTLAVSGRGCLTPEGLLVPALEGPVSLEAASGRILHRDRWPEESQRGGNLLAYPDLVLACAADRLLAFETNRASHARTAALDAGRLALQEGDEAAALAVGDAGAKAEARWRMALALERQGQWAQAAQALESVVAGAPGPERRLVAALRQGEDWRRAGEPGKAVASFQRILKTRSEAPVPWRYGSIRADWAARLAMEEVLDEAGASSAKALYAPIEQEAAARLAAIPPGSEDTVLGEVMDCYPNSAAAQQAAQALKRLRADRHVEVPDSQTAVPKLAWRMRRGRVVAPPTGVPSSGLPLIVEAEGEIRALDPDTGVLRWRHSCERARTPVWAGEALIASEDGQILGLSPKDGQPLWTVRASSRVLKLWPLPSLVLAETLTETLFVDPASGKLLGRLDLGAPLTAPPLLSGGILVALTSSSGIVPARAHWLDPKAAKILASRDLGMDGVEGAALSEKAGVALALLGNRRVLALPLDPQGGTAPRWEHDAQGPVYEALVPASTGNVAVLLPLPGQDAPVLKTLDTASGKLLWETPVPDMDLNGALVRNGSLLAATFAPGRSGAAAWDLETGALRWSKDPWPESVQGNLLEFSGGVLLWAPGRDDAYLLDTAQGRVVKRFGGYADPPERVVPFQAGFLWMGEKALAAYLPGEELDLLRALWRTRGIEASPDRPAEALSLADACFRAGAYGDALSALRAVGLSHDDKLRGEYEARVPFWREVRAIHQPVTLQARHFRTPPEIDGELRDGWVEFLRHDMLGPIDLHRFPVRGGNGNQEVWTGDADLSARLYVGWDDEFFYFAVDVDDQKQVIFNDQGPEIKGDLLMFALDARGDPKHLFQGGIAIQNPRPKPPDPATLPPGDYAAKRRTDDTGTVYEAAIPWQSLRGGVASEDMELRMNLVIGDDDGEGIRKALSLAPGLPMGRFGNEDGGQRMATEFFIRVKLVE